jgi:ribonuclease P protein component
LHKPAEFTAVFNLKHQINGEFIQVYTKPNEFGHARLGLIVSKKIEQHAVKRNWVKRILRETFRHHRSCDQTTKMDWVVRLKRSVNKKDSIKLVTEMKLLMIQLRQCHD